MALVFPSEEWLKELSDRLNADPNYAKAAANWEGTFVFHILPGEGLDEEYILWADPTHGIWKDPKRIKNINEETVNHGLTGIYSIWKKVIKGELDPIRAMITRKMKVIGSMAYILKFKKGSDIIIKTLKGIETNFIDD